MKSAAKIFLFCVFLFLMNAGTYVLGITPVERARLAYEEGQRLELSYEFHKAAEYYMEATKQDKKNAQYHYKLAYVYTQLKPAKINEAVDRLKQITKMDPAYKAAYSLLGQLYIQNGNVNNAETAFERALAIDSQFAEPYFFLGRICQESAKESKSSESQKAIENYQTYLRLAIQGEYLDTAQERLRELAYGDAGVKLNLAILALRNLEYNRSLMVFNSLLQSGVTMTSGESLKRLQQEVHYWRGRLYLIPEAPGYDPTGKKSEREWLSAPDVMAALIELGEWYCQAGETQRAIDKLEAAIHLNPTYIVGPCGIWLNQRAYFHLGKAYMETGNQAKALEFFQKVQDMDPDGEFASEAQSISQLLSGKKAGLAILPDMLIWNRDQLNEFLSLYGGIAKDTSQQRRLEGIIARILMGIQPIGSQQYSVLIVENPAPNALSLPGGQIVVCTGLLEFVRTYLQDSDDVLAFVVGHEMAHLANQDMERSNEGVQIVKAAFAGGKPPLMTFQHGLSRSAEMRADRAGALFAYRAKYNPVSALRWCEAMVSAYGDTDPNGSHPTFKVREQRLKAFLAGELQVAYGKFRCGVEALRKGDYPTASENFLAYLDYVPYDRYALNNLGISYHQQGIRKAGSLHGEWRLAMGLEVKPDIPPFQIRGNPPEGLLDMALMQKAIQQFEAALSTDRRYKIAYKNLGDVYADLGKFDHSREAYNQALEIDAQYSEAINNLGVLLCRQKQFDDGIQAFQKALKTDNNNIEARYNLALAYEYSSEPEKGQDAWQNYLKLDSKSIWAAKARGHLGME